MVFFITSFLIYLLFFLILTKKFFITWIIVSIFNQAFFLFLSLYGPFRPDCKQLYNCVLCLHALIIYCSANPALFCRFVTGLFSVC